MGKESSFQQPLAAALRHALADVDGLRARGVDATASLEELRQRIDVPLTTDGVAAERAIEELVAADWMTAAWDQNAGLYVIGPAASLVEEVAGKWLKSLFGLPAEASFAFVTGCQMAHVTCLAAARHRVLQRVGWDVERDGLGGAP